MPNVQKHLTSAAGVLALAMGALAVVPAQSVADSHGNAMVEQGKKIAFDRKKGNCLACHHIDGGAAAGNIGPPLIAMQVRYTDKDKLRAQIWDATIVNPESPMPPFGSHHILTDKEIDLLVEFVWTL